MDITPTKTYPSDVGIHTVVLKRGETLRNPASTKHLIHGPATVTIQNYADGGTDAVVR